jgi:hypothetical protein
MPLEAFIRSFNSQVADMMESARWSKID